MLVHRLRDYVGRFRFIEINEEGKMAIFANYRGSQNYASVYQDGAIQEWKYHAMEGKDPDETRKILSSICSCRFREILELAFSKIFTSGLEAACWMGGGEELIENPRQELIWKQLSSEIDLREVELERFANENEEQNQEKIQTALQDAMIGSRENEIRELLPKLCNCRFEGFYSNAYQELANKYKEDPSSWYVLNQLRFEQKQRFLNESKRDEQRLREDSKEGVIEKKLSSEIDSREVELEFFNSASEDQDQIQIALQDAAIGDRENEIRELLPKLSNERFEAFYPKICQELANKCQENPSSWNIMNQFRLEQKRRFLNEVRRDAQHLRV